MLRYLFFFNLVPGPVQNVSFRAGITEIYLVWKTPAKLNGVLTGYRLDYHRLSLTGTK